MTAADTTAIAPLPERLQQTRTASYTMASLSTAQKNAALAQWADLIERDAEALLAANQKDLAEQEGKISPSMYQRLKLDQGKLMQLAQGTRDVMNLADPAGRILSETRLDTGLVLEKRTVPLGVVGIIFESRPDVIPQILMLILKSGNAVVLKGGREATHSNRAFMALVAKLNAACPDLPNGWAQLIDTRQDVHEMLNYPQYIDLVIPRGSNELVQSIMAATRIPVLGHADGVCHLFAHAQVDADQAIPLIVDAKTQYPAACNAVETLLIDTPIAETFLPKFVKAAEAADITLKGCQTTQRLIPGIEPATDADWRTEYGDNTLAVRVVDGLEAAITHINQYGSHHTDGILTRDTAAQEAFLARVDSACVFANASTRFADGFRFGLGAELGISTAKTHARGPVGLEGLVIYKYLLRGDGQVAASYVGEQARPFLHEPIT